MRPQVRLGIGVVALVCLFLSPEPDWYLRAAIALLAVAVLLESKGLGR